MARLAWLAVLPLLLVVSGCSSAGGGRPRSTVYSQAPEPDLAIAQARAQAQQSRRLVLLNFGADWCRDSRALFRRFQNDEELSRLLAEKYIMVLIDVGERDGPKWDSDIVQRYGRPFAEHGIPALVVLGPDGEPLFTPEETPLRDSDHRHPRKIQRFLERFNHNENQPRRPGALEAAQPQPNGNAWESAE